MLKYLLIIGILSSNLLASEMTLTGSVISDNDKIVSSRFMGYITNLIAKEGDVVKKGDILYTIDSKEIDSKVMKVKLGIAQLESQLAMNTSNHKNVVINLERHRRLLAKDMVSKFQVENLELAEANTKEMISISKRQIQLTKQDLVELRHQYKYLNVRAPNDGVVVKVNVKSGEMALPGFPAIMLSNQENLKIVADIAERDIKKINEGDKVTVKICSLEFETVGTISTIVPTLNPMSHTIKFKVDFDKGDYQVYPGMYGKILVDLPDLNTTK